MNVILCEDIGGKDHRCIPINFGRANPACDPQCGEHKQPTGYVDAAEWAAYMLQSHEQIQCLGCGLWSIWDPKTASLPEEVQP